MKLGILETGHPPRQLARFGGYPAMFRRLLGEDAYDYAVFDVQGGELPGNADACPAYLITGSASGVYEDLPWIAGLKAFLQAVKGQAALVGICFGHQVMAEAFGGRVMKSPKGWGIGAQTYRIVHPQPWTGDAATITLPASHQDQVVECPPAAEVIACNDFAPFGMLAYADQPAISLQLHPEFEADYAIALAEITRGKGANAQAVEQAIASLRQPDDRALAARWIKDFLAARSPG